MRLVAVEVTVPGLVPVAGLDVDGGDHPVTGHPAHDPEHPIVACGDEALSGVYAQIGESDNWGAEAYFKYIDAHGGILDYGRATRLVPPAMRQALVARDLGCTFPGCTVPGYRCEVHHDNPYATNPVTDINDLTLACGPNHKLAEQGWTTRKNHNRDTEWIPPAHLDHGQPRTNTYHHPEKLLQDDEFP